jgi:hypothetical protein
MFWRVLHGFKDATQSHSSVPRRGAAKEAACCKKMLRVATSLRKSQPRIAVTPYVQES